MSKAKKNLLLGICLIAAGTLTVIIYNSLPPGIDVILAGYDPAGHYSELTITYPLESSLFPPEIVAPSFQWKDNRGECDSWIITLEFQGEAGKLRFLVHAPEWTPEREVWDDIKKRSLQKRTHIMIVGFHSSNPRNILSAGHLSIEVSKDSVDAPLFYREVNLPFADAVRDPSSIRWRFGTISSPEPPAAVLKNLPVCGNCHSFSADGKTLAMDIDYANDKGSYVISPIARRMALTPKDIITWDDYRREDGVQTFGLLSQISPDGRFVVSTVKDESVFVPRPDLAFSQLFFPIKGILCIYDRQTRIFRSLPGADDPELVQSNPTWSPDGKYIVFARAKAYKLRNSNLHRGIILTAEECREFTEERKPFRFDLYRIPYNDGLGGSPQPLDGASNNGMSNYFAKYSPDGKWIVFCRARSYMLLQPDSELYIIPAEGGEARRLNCNTSRMNSWHSWSPNGKWLVFSSKANSPYTQLFLTHIDEQGNSTPAIVLSHLTAPDGAANIPEFPNLKPSAITEIRENFVDDSYYLRAAMGCMRAEDPGGAEQQCKKALQLNPNNAEALAVLGLALFKQGKVDDAVVRWQETVRLDPKNVSASNGLGHAMLFQGKADEAMRYWLETVRLQPDHFEANANLGSLLFAKGKLEDAVVCLSEAARLKPSDAGVRYNLGQALLRLGKPEEAIRHLSVVVQLKPDDAGARYELGVAFARQGRLDAAIRQWSAVLRIDPKNANAHFNLGQARAYQGKLKEAMEHWEEVKRLDPGNIDALTNLEEGYARSGRFSEAASVAENLLKLARSAGNEQLAQTAQQRLLLYARKTAK